MFFEGLAGCVRERQMIKKTSKMKAKSIQKSITNHEQNGPEKVMQNHAPNAEEGGGGLKPRKLRRRLLGGPFYLVKPG